MEISFSATDPLPGLTAFLNFACTPVGQEVIEDLRKINENIIHEIAECWSLIHSHALKTANTVVVTK